MDQSKIKHIVCNLIQIRKIVYWQKLFPQSFDLLFLRYCVFIVFFLLFSRFKFFDLQYHKYYVKHKLSYVDE